MNVYESNKNEEYFPISPRIRRNRSTSTNIDLIDQSVKVSQIFASKLIKKNILERLFNQKFTPESRPVFRQRTKQRTG